jgi:hypothetical protein
VVSRPRTIGSSQLPADDLDVVLEADQGGVRRARAGRREQDPEDRVLVDGVGREVLLTRTMSRLLASRTCSGQPAARLC